ncbi:hypothetical protein [Streptacidiphilus sp. P02-A3a]|uniref:phenylalanine--tRNA ligase subunit beta-related protein n=1 Tax=Streptacidiphilus sp. P02-A3a TaxID=2704468 RepID=UPI0015F9DEB6|nr:hypothetical protein [Streptacidiphilus sp. P02-A3a]QMU67379.1 hypothetical protein GXP74_03275 [Streptacidiphilus sp. P02-A3a]
MRVPVSWLNEFLDRELTVREIDDLLGDAGVAVSCADSPGLLSPQVVAGRIEADRPGQPGTAHVAVPTRELVRLPVGSGTGPPPGTMVAVALPGARLFATADSEHLEPRRNGLTRVGPAGRPGQPVGRICTSAELGLGREHLVHPLDPGTRPGAPLGATHRDARVDEVLTLRVPDTLAHCRGLWGLAQEINLRLDAGARPDAGDRAPAGPAPADAPRLEVSAADLCAAALLLPGPPPTRPPAALDWSRAALAGLEAEGVLERALLLAAFEYGVRLSAHHLPVDGQVDVRLGAADGAATPLRHDQLPLTLTPPPEPAPAGQRRLLVLATAATETTRRGERCRRAVARVAELLDRGPAGTGPMAAVAFGPASERRRITLALDELRQMSGVPFDGPRCRQLLDLIGADCEASTDGSLRTRIPPSRPDLCDAERLAAELVRLHGLRRVPATLPDGDARTGPDRRYRRIESVRRALAGCRFHEMVTPLVSTDPGPARRPTWHAPALGLAATGGEPGRSVRRSLVPGLAAAAEAQAPATAPAALYELGTVVDRAPRRPPVERRSVALLCPAAGEAGYWQVLTAAKAVLHTLGVGAPRTAPADDPAFRPGTGTQLLLAGRQIGRLGVLHPARPDASDGFAVAELDLDGLLLLDQLPRLVTLPSRFPEVQREISLLIPDQVTADQILSAVTGSGPLLRRAEVVDVYRSPTGDPARRAVTVRLVLGSNWHTLERQETAAAVELATAAAVAAGALGPRA